jgi:hypothetical protein
MVGIGFINENIKERRREYVVVVVLVGCSGDGA